MTFAYERETIRFTYPFMKLRLYTTLILMGVSLFFSALSFTAQTAISPQKAKKDSVKDLLDKANSDTTRCNILNQLIEEEQDDAVWPAYNDQMQVICEKNL